MASLAQTQKPAAVATHQPHPQPPPPPQSLSETTPAHQQKHPVTTPKPQPQPQTVFEMSHTPEPQHVLARRQFPAVVFLLLHSSPDSLPSVQGVFMSLTNANQECRRLRRLRTPSIIFNDQPPSEPTSPAVQMPMSPLQIQQLAGPLAFGSSAPSSPSATATSFPSVSPALNLHDQNRLEALGQAKQQQKGEEKTATTASENSHQDKGTNDQIVAEPVPITNGKSNSRHGNNDNNGEDAAAETETPEQAEKRINEERSRDMGRVLERWSSPEGVECWVEAHAVVQRTWQDRRKSSVSGAPANVPLPTTPLYQSHEPDDVIIEHDEV